MFSSSSFRPGHPDFLDLPWHLPLNDWDDHSDRLVKLPTGLSRHPIVFVNYDGQMYALKEAQERDSEMPIYDSERDMAELFCQLIEHKWYLSEREQRDVGHEQALEDFVLCLLGSHQAASA